MNPISLTGPDNGSNGNRGSSSEHLLKLSPYDDYWTLTDSFAGTSIFGATGSGKTSGSGAKITKSFLCKGFGGLVLCVKVDEAELWRKMTAECGRQDDVVVFSAKSNYRFNFMEYEQNRSGDGSGLTENLVKLFLTVMEIGAKKNSKSADEYWNNTLRQLLRNTIDILKLAEYPISVKAMYDVISSAPADMSDATSTEWAASSFCGRVLSTAQEKNSIDPDWEITAQYWLREFPVLAEKTRSIITSSFTSIADNFNRSVLRNMFCTTTNVTPEDCWKGNKIIVLDLSVKEFAEVGQQAQVMFKYLFQKAVERRDLSTYPNPVFLWADEFQFFVHSYDVLFQSTARSSKCATVYLTQNLPGLYNAAGGDAGRHEIDSLLANLSTKIFHALDCPKTREYAANLIGKTRQMRPGFSQGPDQKGNNRTNMNFSEVHDYEVHPVDFMSLKKGGIENDRKVQAILFQSGNTFNATGKNYIRIQFTQSVY